MDEYIELETEMRFTDAVFSHYGNLDYLDEVMDANRKLIRQFGQFIPAGERIRIPIFENPRRRERPSLWSE